MAEAGTRDVQTRAGEVPGPMRRRLLGTALALAAPWPAGRAVAAALCPTPALDAGTLNVPAGALDPRRFGAVGDGRNDDGPAIQRALDALRPGQWLVFAAGRYRHDRRLVLARPGVTLLGSGATLHASRPDDQALLIQADGVRVLGFTMTAVTDRRRSAPWESRIAIWRESADGAPLKEIELRGNRIVEDGPPGSPLANSSSSAAIFVHRAQGFSIIGNTVSRSLSDGIHITAGSRHGVVLGNTVRESGDDMIAVVSYLGPGEVAAVPPAEVARTLAQRRRDELVQDVLIADNDVAGQYWGRGISVVGGEQVSILNNRIDAATHAAGVYIAREQGWCSFGVRDVRVQGNHISRVQTTRPAYTVLEAPQRWQRTGHGAVELVAHVFDDEAAEPTLREALQIRGVLVRDNLIEDASTAGIRIGYGWGQPQRLAWRAPDLSQVLRRYSGAPIRQVQLQGNRLQRVADGGVQVLNAQDAEAALSHASNQLDGRAFSPAAGRPGLPADAPAATGALRGCPSASARS